MNDYTNNTVAFDTANWMKNSLSVLGDKQLDAICMPGSHDAGMSEFNVKIGLGGPNNTLTQTFGIARQLELGVRYFDIRPVRREKKPAVYYCGHTGMAADIYCGALGQSIPDVIAQINSFTKNRQELILINISHCEVAIPRVLYDERADYTLEHWQELFALLATINNKLTIHDVPLDKPLTSNTLSKLLQSGSKVIIFVAGNAIDLPADILPDFIFYNDEQSGTAQALRSKLEAKQRYHNRISIYNEYANKNNVEEMSADQFNKLREHSQGCYFLISWTLTQSDNQAFLGSPSIIELARKADEHAGLLLRANIITTEKFPNIFLVDNIVNDRPALISMMINYKLHAPEKLSSLPPLFCLSQETSVSHWGNEYAALVPFKYQDRSYIFAHTDTNKKWFVSELAPYDRIVDREIIHGNWGNFFPLAVPFKYNNDYYMFAQTDTKKKWFISKLSTLYKDIDTELAHGNWGNQYTAGVSFELNNQPYLFTQTTSRNKYFISKLEPWSDSVDRELLSGNWANFYPTMVSFRYQNKPYLFAQTNSSDHKCFISEFSLDSNTFNRELFTDHWGNYYGTAVAFEYQNEPYLFAQTSSSGNKFFISKLNPFSAADVNTELISGTWANYYDRACVFTYGSKIYLFGLTFNSSKKVFVSELICTI